MGNWARRGGRWSETFEGWKRRCEIYTCTGTWRTGRVRGAYGGYQAYTFEGILLKNFCLWERETDVLTKGTVERLSKAKGTRKSALALFD